MMDNSRKSQSSPDFTLSRLGANTAPSRGRLYNEPDCAMRTPYQRDRDRIIHSTAFRRLTHKTQVFIYHEGDHYRTRLTHTLEVAQIARSLARMLGVDEDLTEAVALAHDLGHSPFGHAGERALNHMMNEFGGFDHNAQSLKQVTLLEHKYPQFDGLNLSYECLEGIVKHNGPLVVQGESEKIPLYIVEFNEQINLELGGHALLEAQVAAIADDIAYCNHDIDDGLRAELISINDLESVELTGLILEDIRSQYDEIAEGRLRYELNRRLITMMVSDITHEARRRFEVFCPKTLEDIRCSNQAYIGFSAKMAEDVQLLRAFLFEKVYRDKWIMKVMARAGQIVEELFLAYSKTPSNMPLRWQSLMESAPPDQCAVHICDFVAGMTDRYALLEHRRLFDATPELR